MCSTASVISKYFQVKASFSGSDNEANAKSVLEQLGDELRNVVSTAQKDPNVKDDCRLWGTLAEDLAIKQKYL